MNNIDCAGMDIVVFVLAAWTTRLTCLHKVIVMQAMIDKTAGQLFLCLIKAVKLVLCNLLVSWVACGLKFVI